MAELRGKVSADNRRAMEEAEASDEERGEARRQVEEQRRAQLRTQAAERHALLKGSLLEQARRTLPLALT